MSQGTLPQQDAPAQAPASAQCLDCGAALAGPHCAACGQGRVGRLGFGSVVSAALGEIASLDTALLRTFVGLSAHPGRVAREYVQGRRTRYLNPLKYALYAVTAYVVTAILFDAPISPDPERSSPYFETVFNLLPYLMLLALVPAAAVQRLLFRGRGDRAAECYVMGLYAYSHVCWVMLPLVLAGAYAARWGLPVIMGLRLAYWMWVTAGFYRSASVWALARAALVFMVFIVMTFVLAALTGVVIRILN